MKLFKHDRNVWARAKEGDKFFWKIAFPIWVITFLILFIILDKLKYYEILTISGLFSYWIVSIFAFIKLPPNWRLPEDIDEEVKRFVYFLQFAVASFAFYSVTVGVLQHYYPFFESLLYPGLENFRLEIKSFSK